LSQAATILVVDDDAEIGLVLKLILEHKAFQVLLLQKANEVENLISQHNIDLIILDMLIGGIKGTDVCASLKANHRTLSIPIIMMTALPDAEQICKEAGANDFITKPFDIDSLLSKINHLLQPR
jgi:DNA-binding response OmpR family regulator